MTEPELLDEPEMQRQPDPSALRRSFESRLIQEDESSGRFAWFDAYLARFDLLTRQIGWNLHKQYPALELDDIIQETRLRLLTANFDPFRPDAPGYVRHAARSAAIDLWRGYLRQQARETALALEHESALERGHSEPDFELDALDPLRRIGTRAGLSDKQMQVLLRVHGLGMTYPEVAEDLDLTEVNVRQIKSRAERTITKAIGLTAQESMAVKLFRRYHPRSHHSSVLELIATEMNISGVECRRCLGAAHSKITAFLDS